MRPARALLPLLFAFLIFVTIESRKDPEEYWKEIMKNQEMPEGLQDLLSFQFKNNLKTPEQPVEHVKHDCEDSHVTNTQATTQKNVLAKEFDIKVGKNDKPQLKSHSESNNIMYGDFGQKTSLTKDNDFKPRPNVTKYDDFEPKPSITKYDDFEPKLDLTKYGDFESIQSIAKYDNFELRSSVNKYNDFEPKLRITSNDFEPRPSASKYND